MSREMLHGLSGKDESKIAAFRLPNLNTQHPAEAVKALDDTLAPLQKHLQKIVTGPRPRATTVVSKTKLAIGALSFSPNEILGVRLDATALQRAQELGFRAESSSWKPGPSDGITRLLVPPGIDAIRARGLLEAEIPGHRFELNRIYRLYRAAMKDESKQSKQTEPISPGMAETCDRCIGRKAVRWRENLSACAHGLKVGIIDTDIDAAHPAFANAWLQRKSFAPADHPTASDWHGTGVLALLAGNPTSGTPGLIPNAHFYSASIFFSEEDGGMATDTLSLLRSLQWLESADVKLINMSFSGPPDDLVRDEIEKMSGKGILFVAAAGNEGPTAQPSYPAAYKSVIAVTAVTHDLRNYRYANRGDHIDVAAPGVDIWTAVPGARGGYHSGTSFAAPFVTGILAVLPKDKLGSPKDQLLDSLSFVDLGDAGRDSVYGRGLITAPSTCIPPNETVASAAR